MQIIVHTLLTLLNWFSWLVAVAAVAMGLYAAFLFITARGDSARLVEARKTLVWLVAGIILAVLSFGAISVIKSFL